MKRSLLKNYEVQNRIYAFQLNESEKPSTVICNLVIHQAGKIFDKYEANNRKPC